MRGSKRGFGSIYQRGPIYWIKYYNGGVCYRESAQSSNASDAQELLKKRLAQIVEGKLVGPRERQVRLEDLVKGYLQDYEINKKRSIESAKIRTAHLERFFGSATKALAITAPRIKSYVAERHNEGAANGTINRELGALGRMFRLAIQSGELNNAPYIQKLEEALPREGFLEHGEYQAIREHLPVDLKDVLNFAYWSGWRKREILTLKWNDLDIQEGVIRLRREASKNKTPPVLPLSEPLRRVIDRRCGLRTLTCPFVFHRSGRPIKSYDKAWENACKAAGLPGKLLHDCRRTVARNLIRSGVPEKIAMGITGHLTRSVFDRYKITTESDLKAAMEKFSSYVKEQEKPKVIQKERSASKEKAVS